MPFQYGQYGGNYDGQPPSHLYQYNQQNGQVPGARQAQQSRQPYQHPQQPAQTPYVTPQYYGQGQSTSFYQTPPSAVQYQQPYASPPLQQSSLPQVIQYSPDPLQRYQQPPRPRQAPPQGYQQQRQPQQETPHRPPQVAQSSRPQAPQRLPAPQNQWNGLPGSPYDGSAQVNAGSVGRSAQIPLQRQPQQRPHSQAVQHQQLPSQSSQKSQSLSDARRPSPIHNMRPVQQPPRQPPSGVTRPSPIQANRPVNVQQSTRSPAVNEPSQASPTQRPMTINPQVIRCQVVPQIPIQRAPSQLQQRHHDPMARSPKRRRSNDGQVLPVCDPPSKLPNAERPISSKQASHRPQHAVQSPHINLTAAASSPLTELPSSQIHPTLTPATSVDYQAMLLSLSDEYISAAHSMSVDLASADATEEQLDQYQSLMAIGMACLESVLSTYTVSDKRKEARIRLRLATLLHEETENVQEAEAALSKGIPVCERARLPDLKYSMHHLLARIWFKGGNVKAAMTAVDKLVDEVEQLRLVHWIYTFRYLRVTFGLLVPESQRETAQLVKNLSAVKELAHRHGHIAIEIVSSAIEAMVQLRTRTPDSVDTAMRAMAAARTHQFTDEMRAMPQIRAFLDFIDLACTLTRFNPDLAQSKMQAMQASLDAITGEAWGADGSFYVPLGQKQDTDIEADTGGIMKQTRTGEIALHITWMTLTQGYSFGYLLSGLCIMNKSSSSEQNAESFLGEGVKLSKYALDSISQSLPAASEKWDNQLLMRIMLRLHIVFAYCGRSEWTVASKGLTSLRRDLAELESNPDQHIVTLLAYLEALCKHGLADLRGALQLYQGPDLVLTTDPDTKPGAANVDPIRILAAMNSIEIFRAAGHTAEADNALKQVEPFCLVFVNSSGQGHGSKALESAYYILKATAHSRGSTDGHIVQTKQYLQQSVQAAKGIYNNQLLSVVMNIMSAAYFRNIVGDQAEKSAKAGRSLAKKCNDKLWIAVADGMYGDTLEKSGKMSEAELYKSEAQDLMQQLPLTLKEALTREDSTIL